jgi:glyoxylate reductase
VPSSDVAGAGASRPAAGSARPANPRPRVFVARRIPATGLDRIVDACDATVWPGELPPSRDQLLASVAGCHGILTLLTDRVDEALLDAAGPQLRVVSNFAVGFDNVDVVACTARGVRVGNTPGVLTETTADLAFALLLASARRIPEAMANVREGRWRTWDPLLLLGAEVHGATIGIVGLGRIGQAVARRAAGFGMRVLYHGRTRAPGDLEASLGATYVPMPELLASSDFVTLHVNLNDQTRGLIGSDELRAMRRTAILVNTSRGPVVDTAALVDALRAGMIAGAALDVTDPEPLPADHPLLGLDACLVVPHVASATRATRDRMATMAADNLLAGVRGQPLPTPVNPEV